MRAQRRVKRNEEGSFFVLQPLAAAPLGRLRDKSATRSLVELGKWRKELVRRILPKPASLLWPTGQIHQHRPELIVHTLAASTRYWVRPRGNDFSRSTRSADRAFSFRRPLLIAMSISLSLSLSPHRLPKPIVLVCSGCVSPASGVHIYCLASPLCCLLACCLADQGSARMSPRAALTCVRHEKSVQMIAASLANMCGGAKGVLQVSASIGKFSHDRICN